MPVGEVEIERLASAMMARYGTGAAREAVMRLNRMIDRRDWDGRERWACVVHLIHQRQGIAPAIAEGTRDPLSRFEPASAA